MAKMKGSGTVIVLLAILLIGIGYATNGFRTFPLSTTTSIGNPSPSPTTSGFSAYCPGSPSTTAGVYPAGAGTTPPAGCNPTAQLISATIVDLYNTGKALTNAYSCVFFWNAGAPATFTAT